MLRVIPAVSFFGIIMFSYIIIVYYHQNNIEILLLFSLINTHARLFVILVYNYINFYS